MKRSLTILFLLILILITPARLNSQEDTLFNTCLEQLKSPFIASGQPFKAFLTGTEVAEFHTTFFKGGLYRIVTSSHENNNVIFSIYDKERNLLFSNSNYDAASYWDFKIEGSIECIVEAKLNEEVSTSGIALMMIGFRSVE